ncbi:MAG: YpiF family protein [Bacillales bacterium]|nr:YpiF family protein [Bacillales bacterium]
MIWNGRDTRLYQQEKSFIDSAVIPLLPIEFGNEMRQAASQGEYIQLFANCLEKQFRGRIMLFPPIVYLSQEMANEKSSLLNRWSDNLQEEGFVHLFFITSDGNWKSIESHLNGTLIWLPATPIEDMDDSFKYDFIENQVKQFVHKIIEKWEK